MIKKHDWKRGPGLQNPFSSGPASFMRPRASPSNAAIVPYGCALVCNLHVRAAWDAPAAKLYWNVLCMYMRSYRHAHRAYIHTCIYTCLRVQIRSTAQLRIRVRGRRGRRQCARL
eukprot:8141423-Pyramimonas_sp.AAC.1